MPLTLKRSKCTTERISKAYPGEEAAAIVSNRDDDCDHRQQQQQQHF